VKWLINRVTRAHRRTFAAGDYDEVRFPSAHADRTPLAGWLVRVPSPKAVVVLCHGISSDRRWMMAKARMLQRRGYTNLLFDFRARGASGGSRCTLGEREVDDVIGAVDFAQAQVPGLPLLGLGESLGAAALVVAMARDDRLQGAVLEACFTSMAAAIRRRLDWLPAKLADRLATRFQAGLLEEESISPGLCRWSRSVASSVQCC
jgi:alpha-beta hydrolase superfamily lysophospholipase